MRVLRVVEASKAIQTSPVSTGEMVVTVKLALVRMLPIALLLAVIGVSAVPASAQNYGYPYGSSYGYGSSPYYGSSYSGSGYYPYSSTSSYYGSSYPYSSSYGNSYYPYSSRYNSSYYP